MGKEAWLKRPERSKLQQGLYAAMNLVPQKDLQVVKDREFNAARYQEQKQSQDMNLRF